MINEQIRGMMRRDTHFRERMEDLGYVYQPIVAVIDWDNMLLHTTDKSMSISNDEPYVRLFEEQRGSRSRTLISERADQLAAEISETEPIMPKQKQKHLIARDILHNIFVYEMVLLNELEDELQLSEDEKLHLVGSVGLTQGTKHTTEEIASKKKPQEDVLVL